MRNQLCRPAWLCAVLVIVIGCSVQKPEQTFERDAWDDQPAISYPQPEIRMESPCLADYIAGGEIPQLLSETNCFQALKELVPVDGVSPYYVAQQLWSDDAHKTRFIAMATTETIAAESPTQWRYPVGTILIKQFDLWVGPGTMQRTETRFSVNTKGGWRFFTYAWDGDDATLVGPRAQKEFTWLVASKWYKGTYTYPESDDCVLCHAHRELAVLGFTYDQLARAKVPQSGFNMLDQMVAMGFVTAAAADQDRASLPLRPVDQYQIDDVRAYMHANCAHCHSRFGVGNGLSLRLEYERSIADTGLCEPGEYFAPDTPMVVDHDPSNSWLLQRVRGNNIEPMPPIAVDHKDPYFVDALRQWIHSGVCGQ